MRKLKLAVAGLTLMSSLAFANFADVPSTHWSYESVKNLYNKGLLAPTLDNAERFNGDGVFSRYEIASMLYSSLEYLNEKVSEKATIEDLTTLKALLENFAPELAEMGLKIDETDKKLAEMEKKISGDVRKQIGSLRDKMNQVKISGDFSTYQEMGLKKNSPGLDNLEIEGNLAITGKVTDNSAVKINLETTLDDENTDSNVELNVIEGKYKSKQFTLTAFRDENKEVPNFADTFALFDSATIGPEQGVIVNGNFDIKGNKNMYLGSYFTKDDVDYFALQSKQDLSFLRKKGINSYVRLSYAEKIEAYQYNKIESGEETQLTDEFGRERDNGLALYSLDTEFSFSPVKMLNLNLAGQYATRKSPNTDDVDSDSADYFPLVGATDAMYLYMSGTVKGTGLNFSGGLYNSGEHFDIGGLGNNVKPVFAESSLVQVGANKKSVMGKVGYNLLNKGILLADLTYTTYGSNAEDFEPASRIETNLTYNAIKNALSFELFTQIDKEAVEAEDQDATQYKPVTVDENGNPTNISAAGEGQSLFDDIEAEDGMLLLRQTTSVTYFKNASQSIVFEYQDDQDKDDYEDTDKYFSVYAENEMTVMDKIMFNTAFSYKDCGLGLKNYFEYKLGTDDGDTWVAVPKNKEFDKYQELMLAAAVEVPTEKYGVFNAGIKYFNHDENGGSVDGHDFVVEAGSADEAEDNRNEKDKEDFSIYGSNKISFGKLSLTYGVKYLIEKEGNEYVDEETKTEENTKENGAKYWTFEDKSKAEGGEYELLYALGVEYDFGNDVIASFSYGDPTISSDSVELSNDKTTFADGEQDQFTFEVAARF